MSKYIFPTLLGAVFLLVGIVLALSNIDLLFNGVQAKGTIIDVEVIDRPGTSRDPKNREVEFYANNSEKIVFTETTGFTSMKPPGFLADWFPNNNQYTIGAEVDVVYHKDNPDRAIVLDRIFIIGFPFLFSLFGGIAFSSGIRGIISEKLFDK